MAAQFSLSRLGRLIRKHWVENLHFHLYATLALIGVLGLGLFIWILAGGHHYQQSALLNIFLIGLFICGAIFASTAFRMLQRKESGTYWLSIPASHLEKLLTAIFYNLIIFTLVYSLCFLLVEQIATSVIISRVKADPASFSYKKIDWQNDKDLYTVYKYFVYIFFGVQALYMLGSVYFRKYSFILTTFVLAVAITLLMCYLNYLGKSLPDNYYFIQGTVKEFNTGSINRVHYELPVLLEKISSFLVNFGWAPVFWWATYYRLTEKEI